MKAIRCPEPICSSLAEIADHFVLESSDGPIEYVKLQCHLGHLLTVPRERLSGYEVLNPHWPGVTE